jgi:DNA polymerase (family 10)
VSPDALERQIELVRSINDKLDGIEVLVGTETNILPDGAPDYDDDLLAQLDWVVGSVHTSFGMSEAEMTKRIVAAIEHPFIDCIGHLTGRKIESRKPYEVDTDAVFAAAAKAGTMIEINSAPDRRDINDVHARAAKAAGVTIIINTDAHGVSTQGNSIFGIATARRAGFTKDDLANTLPWKKFGPLRKRAAKAAK